jgi:hypothetical protein
MKKIVFPIIAICATLLILEGCEPGIQESNIPDENSLTTYSYSVAVSAVNQTNAPALQSFAHGVAGDDILLFGGRTNQEALDGGLHNLSANYADSSFVPRSYNKNIYVYNITNDERFTMLSDSLLAKLKKQFPAIDSSNPEFFKNSLNSLFKVTNPISTQEGDTLYVLGGYGYGPNLGDSAKYYTYNQVSTIDVPTMIKLVKGIALDASEWQNLIRFGTDTSNSLISAGAEMFKIGDSIYLAGGHNFGDSVGQKYLDAVYPFVVIDDARPCKLNVSVGNFISNVIDPKAKASDSSTFRRRDGPVTAALFQGSDGEIIEGFNFYAGVFMPSKADNPWSTAINIHPASGPRYTIDRAYNQKSQSVYACSDFVGYDSTASTLHTFLLGGIGNDTTDLNSTLVGTKGEIRWLKAFTNSGLHVQMDLKTMKSKEPAVLSNVFPSDTTHLYGAESTLIPWSTSVLSYVQINGTDTEVLDLDKTFPANNTITVGYVFGGIEAFQLNPGTYGPSNSAASNKVWEVTLTRLKN